MEELALETIASSGSRGGLSASAVSTLPFPWRDPKSVSKAELAVVITQLEVACAAQPTSAPLRTCLGVAQAMNYDVQVSMHTLDIARNLDTKSFWAQQKFAELLYRLRCLPRAEQETISALELATSTLEVAVARRQLSEIRALLKESTQKPNWTKPLARHALVALAGVCVLVWAAVQL